MLGINKFYKKIKIQNKLLLFILSFTIIIYLVAFSFIIFGVRDKVFEDAEKLIQANAREYANLVTKELNYDFDLTQGLGWAAHSFEEVPEDMFFDFYEEVLHDFVIRNTNFFSTWISWEINAIDPEYDVPYGRIRQTYYRQGNQILYKQDTLNMDGDDIGSLYHQVKVDKENFLSDPYYYTYTGKKEDEVLEVSPCIPILINDHFAGLAGTDIILSRFQELTESIKPFDVGYTFIISNDGTYVGHPNEAFVGQNIADMRTEYVVNHNIVDRIKDGDFFTHVAHDSQFGGDAYVAYAPVNIGNTELPWAVGTVVPTSIIVEQANIILLRSIIVALLGLIVLSYIIFLVSRKIAKPLGTITKVLEKLSFGDLKNTEKIKVNTSDEIGQISIAINSLLEGLTHTASFANEIGQGNLDVDFKLLGENDSIGEALLNMRESLKKAREEEEKRKKEDERRSWATHGQALFADILRQDNNDMETLSFNVIKNLVKYLNANQGGIFIINDDNEMEKFLELTACYAYDRKKYLEKTVKLGEGLVGACFLERKTIHMKQVPEDYISITSGLGDENPSVILIVPLIVNEEIFGVVELAAFKDFEDYQIEFVEKVGESIASTISSVKINVKTKFLLEQSQQQSEEMRAQEEEMRQNMEEMHATQEEMARKEHALQQQLELSNKFLAILEYNDSGIILKANDIYCSVSGYMESELVGNHVSMLFDNKNYKESDGYKKFWSDMQAGNVSHNIFKRLGKEGRYFICKGISSPEFDESGQLKKIIELSVDITDIAEKE